MYDAKWLTSACISEVEEEWLDLSFISAACSVAINLISFVFNGHFKSEAC